MSAIAFFYPAVEFQFDRIDQVQIGTDACITGKPTKAIGFRTQKPKHNILINHIFTLWLQHGICRRNDNEFFIIK